MVFKVACSLLVSVLRHSSAFILPHIISLLIKPDYNFQDSGLWVYKMTGTTG